MCGGFTCSKNTLVGLNLGYIIISLIMIGVAVHGKASGIITSLPIVGGITACGIFLLAISVVGLIGAMKHHQVMLFFYMVVLFLIFLIQFSVSCAALAIDDEDEIAIVKKAWNKVDNNTILDVENTLGCCGLDQKDSPNRDCTNVHVCTPSSSIAPTTVSTTTTQAALGNASDSTTAAPQSQAQVQEKIEYDCPFCMDKIKSKVNAGFNGAGGVGLFFSFTELIGALVACRYRSQLDPFSTPQSAPFASGNI